MGNMHRRSCSVAAKDNSCELDSGNSNTKVAEVITEVKSSREGRTP
jgi:hypothetical protein